MPKRKKYPKLPNGYGSIKYLGKGRRNPYAVHPPTQEFTLNGSPSTPKAICYTDTWIKGFTVLTAYKGGTYYPGMELKLNLGNTENENIETLAQKILADYNAARPIEKERLRSSKTFTQIYEEFYNWKFVSDQKKEYSENTLASTRSAYKRCAALHSKAFQELRHDDLQKVIDDCQLSHASLELMVGLFHQMCKYALMKEYVEKDYSKFVKINVPDDDTPGESFTDKELSILWENKEDPTIEFAIIMCYSGYRIKAYKTLEINLSEMYFKGGVKTKSSKGRVVPIHPAIVPLIKRRLRDDGEILSCSIVKYRQDLYKALEKIEIRKHTPHDCRHTFSMLCEKYDVNENDRKRMLGHSFGADITNSVYGHRSLEELQKQIKKIKVCY